MSSPIRGRLSGQQEAAPVRCPRGLLGEKKASLPYSEALRRSDHWQIGNGVVQAFAAVCTSCGNTPTCSRFGSCTAGAKVS